MSRRTRARVLVLDPESKRRMRLSDSLRAAGITVTAVSRLAELERWPAGEIVVTDARHFSEWWRSVGARHVIVLTDTAEEGFAACARGASMWLPRSVDVTSLIGAVRNLATNVAGKRE